MTFTQNSVWVTESVASEYEIYIASHRNPLLIDSHSQLIDGNAVENRTEWNMIFSSVGYCLIFYFFMAACAYVLLI